jgi:hypothetical protein
LVKGRGQKEIRQQKMKWKVTFVRPDGKSVGSPAFRMLFPFATRAEAEEIAGLQRFSWPHVVVTPADDTGNPIQPANSRGRDHGGQTHNLPNSGAGSTMPDHGTSPQRFLTQYCSLHD